MREGNVGDQRGWLRAGLAGLVVVAGAGGAAAGIGLSGSRSPDGLLPGGALPGTHPRSNVAGASAVPARLVSYDSCSDMLDQLRAAALSQVGPYGLSPYRGITEGGGVSYGMGVAEGAPSVSPAAAPTAENASPSAASGTSGSTASYSGTNNQEQGVDEPDLVKTDGRLLAAIRQNTDALEVADVASPTPQLTGTLDLSSLVRATGMLLVGSDVVVIGGAVTPPTSGGTPSPGPVAEPPIAVPQGAPTTMVPWSTDTEVVVVDVTDPGHPSVKRSFSISGNEVDARLVGGIIDVVVRTTPELPFVSPTDSSSASLSQATAANRAIVESSNPADWLPTVTSKPSGITTVAPCQSAMHVVGNASGATANGASASTASGQTTLGTIGVVPIDPNTDQPGTQVSVVGDASTVYASTHYLYVASSTTPEPVPVPEPLPAAVPSAAGGVAVSSQPATSQATETTAIDAFDLSDPSAPRYVGSGTVPGTMIGQYAMSEYQGDLRVATTVGTATPPPGEGTAPANLSDNQITVLRPQGGALVPIGAVTGMGAGEKIYAVRYIGALAYVVTFRQTDPLYVVDLSDPTNPHTAGQLPLTGYSSFLEPVGDGLVLGIGQAVDSQVRRDGLQVSLFDVSDPATPTLVAKDVISGANSSAESDPHALLWWAAAGLAVLPVQQYPTYDTSPGAPVPTDTSAPWSGAEAWHISASALTEAGRITQPAPPTGSGSAGWTPAVANPSIEREVVVGSKLYTMSEDGILESDLGSLSPETWMAFS